ncbi:branched-chain amino acid ABC transporter permease [Streptomyces sp. NPDC005231]|uniref:branched-chain amino acid ABC transporter permease n=1 Tax=Streptomyces sp. NPDC005231 TaxID=3157026 RepID=UPI0033AA2886
MATTVLWGIGSDYWTYLAALYMVWLIAGMGMNLVIGTGGLTALHGPAAMGVGAYAAVLAMEHKVPVAPGILIGGAAAGILMTLLLLPTLRLRPFYFTVATFVAVLLVQNVLNQAVPVTGGPYGKIVPTPTIGSLTAIDGTLVLVAVYLALATGFIAWLAGSAFVVKLRAVRDSAEGAKSAGLSVFRIRAQALLMCNVLLGVAGGLLGVVTVAIVPSSFGLPAIVSTLLVAWVGGLDRFSSPVIGALLVSVVPAVFTELQGYSDFFTVAVLFAVLMLAPNGALATLPGASSRRVLR